MEIASIKQSQMRTKTKLTKDSKSKCKLVKAWNINYQNEYNHKYINNLSSPAIMEDVELNVQRHKTTRPENSELVFLWSRE